MNLLKNNLSLFMFFLIGILPNTICFGQEDKDLENWSSVRLRYKLNKKLAFTLEQQLRLDENISEVSEYFTQLSTKYSISKGFAIGGALRFIREHDNQGNIQGYENHFRFHLQATYKHKIDAFSLKYRLRYQNKNELGISASEGDYAKNNIRLKTTLGYNIKNWKLDPEVAFEIFNSFEKEEENEFTKYRLTFGTEYEFKKLGTLGLYYRIQKELNETIPQATNIIGLKYTYTIKN